jgi:DNA-binding IclR family transcriptional regulator
MAEQRIADTDSATSEGNGVASVVRAMSILSSFNYEHPELGLTEIARSTGYSKSTVHRLLRTLEAQEFVKQLDGTKYTLGWKVFELGSVVLERERLRDVLVEEANDLVEQTRETSHIGVLDNQRVLYVVKVESPRPFRMPSSVGRRAWPHCSSIGKVLLSGLDEKSLDAIIDEGLPKLTALTITEPESLRKELTRVRENRLAISCDESEEAVMSIAAPIFDDRGLVCAAINVSGPTSRMRGREEVLCAAVREAAERLSARLGPKARLLYDLGSTLRQG